MFSVPDYVHNVSLKLSEALSDIGVNEKILMKRRRACLLTESLCTRFFHLQDMNESMYNFGSQSEGTLTGYMCSDTDHLFTINNSYVIQDWSEWEYGKVKYLMIQDETVSPGYCLLQALSNDAPLPYNEVPNENYFRDRTGRILLKNTLFNGIAINGYERHGPATTMKGNPGFPDVDYVPALPCKTWPKLARPWLERQSVGPWPSNEMRRYCSTSGCFVVAVGSKGSVKEQLEWRISTSLAERCLMFNLNITQFQCYVLMKLILKAYIKPHFKDTISSYICKTVLFHCISNTHYNFWRGSNLLACFQFSLLILYNYVSNENCPHFVIPENNLLAGRILPESKYFILDILENIFNSEGSAFLGIEDDDFSASLRMKMNGLNRACSNYFTFRVDELISGQILKDFTDIFGGLLKDSLLEMTNDSYETVLCTCLKHIFRLVNISNESQGIDKRACGLLLPWFCTQLGSTLASLNISQYNDISQDALTWISLGLNTDVSSNKLKLASMLYNTGDIQGTENILRDIEGKYKLRLVEPACKCHANNHYLRRTKFDETAADHDEEAIKYTIAFCVGFLPTEMNCVLRELRYEMFRSTAEERCYRGRKDYWMDWAVVDSLPYLYFLQYKTYGYLGRHEDQQRALSRLVWTINTEPNLGHRETALNLLGQSMEQEGRASDALHYYNSSLNIQERENAARFHICRLLSSILNTLDIN